MTPFPSSEPPGKFCLGFTSLSMTQMPPWTRERGPADQTSGNLIPRSNTEEIHSSSSAHVSWCKHSTNLESLKSSLNRQSFHTLYCQSSWSWSNARDADSTWPMIGLRRSLRFWQTSPCAWILSTLEAKASSLVKLLSRQTLKQTLVLPHLTLYSRILALCKAFSKWVSLKMAVKERLSQLR